MGKVIAFWSPVKGRAGVTSSSCAVLAMLAMLYPQKTLALCSMDGRMGEAGLKLETRSGLCEDLSYYERTGMNALTMKCMQEELSADTIRHFGIPLLLDHVFLYSSGEQDPAFETIKQTVVMDKVRNEFDLLLLDLETGRSERSDSYLKKADVVVVVLPPEKAVWEEYGQNLKKMLAGKKAGVLLGRGIKDSKYNAGYFSKKWDGVFGKFLGTVPESAGYLDAMIERRTLEFFLRNRFSEKKDSNYEFIFQTKQAAEQLMRCAAEQGKKLWFL